MSVCLNFGNEYATCMSDNMVTPWGGMKEMKMLIDKSGIRNKLLELGLPQGKSNNSIDAVPMLSL